MTIASIPYSDKYRLAPLHRMRAPVMLLAVAVFAPALAYGHGVGLDTIQSVDVQGRSLSISVEMPPDAVPGQDTPITITATEDGQETKNVTFLIGMLHADRVLFRDHFLAEDGILRLEAMPSESPDVTIGGERDSALGAWRGSPVRIEGPILEDAGLYTFEIEVRTIDDPANTVESDMHYADLSVVEEAFHTQKDSQGGEVTFKTKSYFDRISSFRYDPEAGQVTFEMPFDWGEGRFSHIPVVHEEVHIPNDFAEFFTASYTGEVNGERLFKASVTVDDYTEEDERIVHFVLLQDHLRLLKNAIKDTGQPLPDTMSFTLKSSDEFVFPLEAYTRSEDFLLNLSWDPVDIEPGVENTFVFTIRDGATIEPLRNSGYTFVIVQNGEEIHRVSGVARVGGHFEKFTFGEDQTGPATIRFEDIRGTGQETEFGIVVAPEFGAVLMLVLAVSLGGAALASGRFRYRT